MATRYDIFFHLNKFISALFHGYSDSTDEIIGSSLWSSDLQHVVQLVTSSLEFCNEARMIILLSFINRPS